MLLSDIRKSIGSILYERVASPFSGAFLLSWCIWNWEILYLTLFVSESKIPNTKIDYITENFLNQSNLLWYPLISTAILILIIPYLSNGSYWVNLQFRQWKLNKKDKVENKQLLSIEKSIELRRKIREREIELEGLIDKKNEEIDILEKTINQLEDKLQNQQTKNSKPISDLKLGSNNLQEKYNDFKSSSKFFDYFDIIGEVFMGGDSKNFPSDVPKTALKYYLVNGIIEKSKEYNNAYHFTKLGHDFYKLYFNESYN